MDSDNDGLGDPCDPFPSTSKARDSTVFVTFDSITIHNDHDPGSGNWDLAAYVQGKRIMLTEATSRNVVCGDTDMCYNLWFASEDQTYSFDRGTTVKAIVPEKFQLSVFTAGSEVDDCGRKSFTEVYPNLIDTQGNGKVNPDKISTIQSGLNNFFLECPGQIFDNKNDVLGVINEAYDLVPGKVSKEVTSSNGDFTIRYTINVIPSP
jgi:hypothetical protein